MEKINTPVTEAINRKKHKIYLLKEQKERIENNPNLIDKRLFITELISELEREIEEDEKLLQKEREVIEGAHKAGQTRCTTLTSEHLAKNYYNQTFKSNS